MRDIEGARRISEELLATHTDEPAGQVRTTALITAAFADLESGHLDKAVQRFTQVCDRPVLPRFFLDWYWRMIGQIGLGSARLAKGDLEGAKKAVGLAQTGASSANPAMKAMTWNLEARIALAAGDLESARDAVERALTSSAEAFEIPVAASKIHATAAAYYLRAGDPSAAECHRVKAKAAKDRLIQSLPAGDPLGRYLQAE
jgi:ATP/maltotriose-dependent transcriptional regulator MalT